MENEKTKKLKLTKTVVETLPYAEKGKQADYYDSELNGFGIRVSHTGKKYFVRRLIGSKRSRVTIGSHPIKTAEIARSEARVLLGSMESGIDPNKQKKELARLEEEEKLRVFRFLVETPRVEETAVLMDLQQEVGNIPIPVGHTL